MDPSSLYQVPSIAMVAQTPFRGAPKSAPPNLHPGDGPVPAPPVLVVSRTIARRLGSVYGPLKGEPGMLPSRVARRRHPWRPRVVSQARALDALAVRNTVSINVVAACCHACGTTLVDNSLVLQNICDALYARRIAGQS